MNKFLLYATILILASCQENKKAKEESHTSGQYLAPKISDGPANEYLPESDTDSISCEDLDDTAVVYALAKEAQENGFPAFHDFDYFIMRGHFSSTETEQILIRAEAHAGVSCGSCCNMLLLYSCEDKIRKIWSGYTGNFTKENIRDLNGDGILEIESYCGFTWSCTLGDRYSIFNLQGEKENILYESNSENYMIDACGDMQNRYQNGDTISYFFLDSLLDPERDGMYQVRRIRERAVFHGGKTEAEIDKFKTTVRDTVFIDL